MLSNRRTWHFELQNNKLYTCSSMHPTRYVLLHIANPYSHPLIPSNVSLETSHPTVGLQHHQSSLSSAHEELNISPKKITWKAFVRTTRPSLYALVKKNRV